MSIHVKKMTYEVETAPPVVKMSLLLFKGVGIFATVDFSPGAFLLQYTGELIEEAEAEQREKKYRKMGKGCFIYYFEYNRKIRWYVLSC